MCFLLVKRALFSAGISQTSVATLSGTSPDSPEHTLETGRMLVCKKNRRDRSGRQAGCSAERPGGPIRLVARPVSPQLTAAHPRAPRLAATPTRPRGTITLHRHPSGDGLSGCGLGETIAVARVPMPGSDPKDGLAERLRSSGCSPAIEVDCHRDARSKSPSWGKRSSSLIHVG